MYFIFLSCRFDKLVSDPRERVPPFSATTGIFNIYIIHGQQLFSKFNRRFADKTQVSRARKAGE